MKATRKKGKTREVPIQVSFDGVPWSAPIEQLIQDRASMLLKFHDRLTSCHVVVSSDRQRMGKGRLYSVRVDLVAPGGKIPSSRTHRMKPQSHQLEAAIDRAFHVARRRLEDFVRRMRGAVKLHQELPVGRISKLLPGGAAGFIQRPDGRDIYFSRNAVRRSRFGRLSVGDTVSYVEEEGRDGPNASSVKPIAPAGRIRLRPKGRQVLGRVKK